MHFEILHIHCTSIFVSKSKKKLIVFVLYASKNSFELHATVRKQFEHTVSRCSNFLLQPHSTHSQRRNHLILSFLFLSSDDIYLLDEGMFYVIYPKTHNYNYFFYSFHPQNNLDVLSMPSCKISFNLRFANHFEKQLKTKKI